MFEINTKLSELIGILIGDGIIYYNTKIKKYFFEITGDPKLEVEYFDYVSSLVQEIINKKPSIRVGGRGLRLRLYSKEFIEFLIYELGLPYGKKSDIIKIPEKINNWNLLKYCIRGITDTDGSLFLSKKENNLYYPSIEISTNSKFLAFQIFESLKDKYRMCIRKFSKEGINDRYIVSVNGNIMVRKWIEEIGFSNKRKLRNINKISQTQLYL